MNARTGVETARAVADAVLYRGHQLYPYLSGVTAHQACGPFGALVPPAFAAGAGEHSSCHAECLLEHEPGGGAGLVTDPGHQADLGVLRVRVRFLRLVDRSEWVGRHGALSPVGTVRAPHGGPCASQEAVACEEDALIPLADLLVGSGDPDPDPALWTIPVVAPAGREVQPVTAPSEAPAPGGPWRAGAPAAASAPLSAREAPGAPRRVVRAWHRLDAELRLSARWLPGPFRAARLSAELRNTSRWSPGTAADGLAAPGVTDRAAARDEALRQSLIAAHLVFCAPGWRFLSLTDPPWWAVTYAACCHNERAWPVLVGDGPGHDDTVLAAPVVLPDHPRPDPIAPAFGTTRLSGPLAAHPHGPPPPV
ncbi:MULTISPECIES: hypothetical protein [unclassified Pseudofrankia]|uniref:hypothetical protein n=1 Tax=unclassified Pseudofrankia TaxID=2994372 RepID=UPI0008DA633F|nr:MULTISPECIES: hypothetical protein [unclassified Pseudofrankia]MDT3440243.1 hypothetical protein [Pseudofrankia sp. BMG5.37]OHV58665.1 hypothetical protein BCD48_42410 [Pseudofrankia sp. BMG5.36]